MTIELRLLGWTVVLAVVQILLHARSRSRETGIEYNAGPRDSGGPPVGVLTGRLERARNNLLETLPLFAAAVLATHAAGREGLMTEVGAWLYLLCRIVYFPLYAGGIPYVRSLSWVGSMVGLALVLIPLIF